MQQFLSPYTKVIRLGFSTSAKNMTAFNAAMSYNLHHAMQQDDEGFHIDYEKIAISPGIKFINRRNKIIQKQTHNTLNHNKITTF